MFDLGLCLDGWSDEPAVDVGGRRQFVFLCLRFLEATLPSLLAKAARSRPRNRDGLVRHHSISRGLCGRLIGGPLFAALGAQVFIALAITCCVWFALRYRTPEPPRHRSRLLPLEWQGQTQVLAALWHKFPVLLKWKWPE